MSTVLSMVLAALVGLLAFGAVYRGYSSTAAALGPHARLRSPIVLAAGIGVASGIYVALLQSSSVSRVLLSTGYATMVTLFILYLVIFGRAREPLD